MPDIDVLASNRDETRTVTIQVKTKTGKGWQTSIKRGRRRAAEMDPQRFWVLVDLHTDRPGYFVIPEWWMQNDIYRKHAAYLRRHGGKRAVTPTSTHHAIAQARVEQWRDRWDLLGLLDA